MKRTALCLYGYFSNRENENAGMLGYEYIKENILKYPNVDVFVHTWDLKNEKKIIELYNPKRIIAEKQLDYNAVASSYGLYQSDIDEGFDRNSTIYVNCTIQASLSFYNSRAMSILLKREYERDNNFEYDVVITARFDLGHRSGFHRGYNVSQITFNPENDMNYIYSSMWVQINCGFADQWFYSNSENMNKFIYMGDHAIEDFKLGSNYNNALINGWFDSNADDEFSNEVLKPKENRTTNLFKYPQWQIINNHLYHKFYLNKVELYEKSKYV